MDPRLTIDDDDPEPKAAPTWDRVAPHTVPPLPEPNNRARRGADVPLAVPTAILSRSTSPGAIPITGVRRASSGSGAGGPDGLDLLGRQAGHRVDHQQGAEGRGHEPRHAQRHLAVDEALGDDDDEAAQGCADGHHPPPEEPVD